MDYGELARQVTEYLQPVLVGGGNLALGVGANAIYDLLKRRFTRSAAGALAEAEEHPEIETNREALQVQIHKALEEDAAFREELLALLPAELRAPAVTQKSKVKGDGNIVIQYTGQNVDINAEK